MSRPARLALAGDRLLNAAAQALVARAVAGQAQITKYMSVTDSGEFLVDDHVRALVGKPPPGQRRRP
jgi:hypothetical protein